MSPRPPLRIAAAALILAAVPGAAQTRPTATPKWSWYLSTSVGLVGREIATWQPTHAALDPTGWDSRFQSTCVYYCQNASEVVEGRPVAPTLAVRRELGDSWQVRLMGALASPGYYPGGYANTPLTVEPKTATLAAQAVKTVKAFWVAAGPSYYRGQLTTTAGSSQTTARSSGLGLVLTGGATFPQVTNWFVETTLERRFAGSVTTPVLPVPGAPDVPALKVPLSATVLSVGVGWRL
jgi:hypothetical protein